MDLDAYLLVIYNRSFAPVFLYRSNNRLQDVPAKDLSVQRIGS